MTRRASPCRYEQYLDSQITNRDIYYLEDVDVVRHLVELGYCPCLLCTFKLAAAFLRPCSVLAPAAALTIPSQRFPSQCFSRVYFSTASNCSLPQHLQPSWRQVHPLFTMPVYIPLHAHCWFG